MKFLKRSGLAIAACVLVGVALAGCGSDNTSTSNSNAAEKTAATQSTSAAMSSATVSTKDSSLGAILAGDKSLTLYMFEKDKGGKSNCNGQCAAAWPPMLTKGSAAVTGDAKSDKVGTVKRSDGTTQVTYAGHPVYYFTKDKDAADVYGQEVDAFGGEWYAMTSSGSKAEGSASSTSSSDSGSGGY